MRPISVRMRGYAVVSGGEVILSSAGPQAWQAEGRSTSGAVSQFGVGAAGLEGGPPDHRIAPPRAVASRTMTHDAIQLFDERTDGGFPERFGEELVHSWSVDLALKRLRLTGIDLSDELEGLRAARLVLAQLSAPALDAEAHALVARPEARRRIGLFLRLVEESRVRIRVAPLGGWSPDFSVFSDFRGPRSVLLGFHQFERTHPLPGPALGARFGRRGALLARARFEEIWTRAHDVLPAVQTILARAHGSLPAAASPGPGAVDTLRALG